MSKQARIPVFAFDDFSTGVSQPSSIFADLTNPLDPHYGMKAAADADNVIMNEVGLEKFMGNANTVKWPFTVDPGTDTVTCLDHSQTNGAGVEVESTGTLPEPLTTGTTYYIGAGTQDSFQFYEDADLTTPIDLTTEGTGTHTLVNAGPVITGLFLFKTKGTNAESYNIVCAGTRIYTSAGSALTQIYSGVTAGAFFSFKTYQNVCLIMNGVDSLLQYDGTTCEPVVITDPDGIFDTAKPALAELFRNRIFYSGDPVLPSRVWTPQPGTYNNFDNATSQVDAFDVSPGDGGAITGLKVLSKDLMVIYKESSTFRLSGSNPFGAGTDTFLLEEISRDIGCIASRTIVLVGRDHFFLSTNGMKRLTIVNDYGDVLDADPTYEIKDAIDGLNFTESIIANAFAVYVKAARHIYLHVPTGSSTQNDKVFVYDIKTGANMPRSGITASCGAMWDRLYFTGSYTGHVNQQSINDSYAGEAISSFWESKWLAFYGLKNKKNFKYLQIYFESSGTATITVQWQIMKRDGTIRTVTKSSQAVSDDVFDIGLWDEALFDNGNSVLFGKNNLGRGVALKLRITNNKADEHWKIRKVELGVINLGRVAA